MFQFKKKDTPISNIAFMSLMAAINVVFALLMAFIPYIVFILILILPLSSVLVALYCQKRYYPLYIIVTLGLCFISAIWDITIPIFYILPSMLTGFIFALFLKLKLPNIFLIVVPSLIQLSFNYLGIYFSYLITGENIIEVARIAFKLQDFTYYYAIVPSFILVISLMQSLFSYMIIKDELPKFKYEINDDNQTLFYLNVGLNLALLLAATLLGIFKVLNLAYLALTLSSVFALNLCVKSCVNKPKLMIILNVATFVVNIVVFSVSYQYLKDGTALLLFGIFYFLTTIYAIVNNCLLKSKKIVKIESAEK